MCQGAKKYGCYALYSSINIWYKKLSSNTITNTNTIRYICCRGWLVGGALSTHKGDCDRNQAVP